jgi:CheY-like chemotaxis protein
MGRPYDAVVLDSDMPEMNGAEVAAAIRSTPALRSTRVVMLTSAGAPAGSGEDAAAQWFLTKPVRRSALLEVLAEALSEAEPSDAPAATTVAASAAVATRGRVLVAEDNPVNQLVIETMLRRRGFIVDIASDGLQAVERLDPQQHDAVFMDCQMPNLDGYEATERIRAAEPADRHIPIVAMTAHAFAGDRERCLRAGMDDYLSKPLRGEDLEPVLERWLGSAVNGAQEDGLVDRERAQSLIEIDPALILRLLETFARTTPPLLEDLRAAAERGEEKEVRRLAHKLRGSCETLGALRLSQLARELELGEGGAAVAEQLQPVYRDTLQELEALGPAG